MTDPLTIRWTPRGALPRQLTFEPTDDGYVRIGREWNSSYWQACGSELLTTRPTTEPTENPPTLEELITEIRNTWDQEDPTVLTFLSTIDTVAAVGDDLRYRSPRQDRWHTISTADLESHLRTAGYPTTHPFSETPSIPLNSPRTQSTSDDPNTHSRVGCPPADAHDEPPRDYHIQPTALQTPPPDPFSTANASNRHSLTEGRQ